MGVLDDLKRDHRSLEKAAEELVALAESRSNAFEAKAVAFFRAFYNHAVSEENNLIKPLRERGVVGNAFVTELFGEHKQLYQDMGIQLRKAMAQQADNPRMFVAVARNLLYTLRTHFRKEENLLYQLAERTAKLPRP